MLSFLSIQPPVTSTVEVVNEIWNWTAFSDIILYAVGFLIGIILLTYVVKIFQK